MSPAFKRTLFYSFALLCIAGIVVFFAMPAMRQSKAPKPDPKPAITNNLRHITSAGQMHMLEEGVDDVSYEELLEAKRFPPMQPVDGESYADLIVFTEGGTLEVTTQDGQSVTYKY